MVSHEYKIYLARYTTEIYFEIILKDMSFLTHDVSIFCDNKRM